MALFFTDPTHTYSLSPANYTKIKRIIQQAKTIGQSAFNISLISGSLIEGQAQNEFLWKYAKVALTNTIEDEKAEITKRSRILLCQSIRIVKDLTTYQITNEFGVYVPVNKFMEAGEYLFAENQEDSSIAELNF